MLIYANPSSVVCPVLSAECDRLNPLIAHRSLCWQHLWYGAKASFCHSGDMLVCFDPVTLTFMTIKINGDVGDANLPPEFG